MEFIDGKQWIAVRKSNLKYYDDVELHYRNPVGKIALYKPKGMSITDKSLEAKPYLGSLYIKPADKIRALREAQKGFSSNLTAKVMDAGPEQIAELKNDLTVIVDETLNEPRSGGLDVVPGFVNSIVHAYSEQPTVIKQLARISHADYSTAIHSINVMALTVGYCFYTARGVGETEALGLAALLHDVGKVDVDPEILTAPRRLTDAEFQAMTRHTTAGAKILDAYGPELAIARDAALHHHLKLDGSGYPTDLNEEPSEAGRIIAIIDAYEALTNDDRPYRSGMKPLEALRVLKEDVDAGKYDKEIFSAFAYSLTEDASFGAAAAPEVDRPDVEEIAGSMSAD